MNTKYKNIFNLTHTPPSGRKPMSNADRAAQFAPFAALTGYEEAVLETARVTDSRPELLEDEKRDIDAYLKIIRDGITAKPRVGITYFVADKYKPGGKLIDKVAPAVAVKEDDGAVVFEDGTVVKTADIVSIIPAFRDGFEFRLY